MTRSLAAPVLVGLLSSGCYLLKSAAVDETCEDLAGGCGGAASSEDADGDGFSEADGDCDDTNADVFPGAEDIPNDGVDQDCDGADGGDLTDADGDGFYAEEDDCDDSNADVNPGMVEQCLPAGVDDNCDGLVDDEDDSPAGTTTWYLDNDGDGYGSDVSTMDACQAPEAHVADAGDCEDRDAGVYPTAPEICNNGVDDNCNDSADDCLASGTIAPTDGVGVWEFSPGAQAASRFDVADVTGDGMPDGIIGLPVTAEWPNGGVVIMDRPPMGATLANGGTAGASLVGLGSVGFGRNVVGTPDLTGDGYADLIATNDEGVVYLASGPIVSGRDDDLYAQLRGLQVPADTRGMLASDINGDGIADLIVAGASVGSYSHGRLVAKPGPISGTVQDLTRGTILDIEYTDWFPIGEGADSFGEAVHAVDFDGDGLNDLAVGVPDGMVLDSSTGDVYQGGVLFITEPFDSIVGFCTNMAGVESQYGSELASADLDGDGLPELLVGDPAAAGADRSSTGAVYVHAYGDLYAEEAWATIRGAEGAKLLGWSIQTGETDGFAGTGVLLGVPDHSSGTSGAVLGFHTLASGSHDSTDADFVISGAGATTYFGADIALADMDGNGTDDLFTMMGDYSGIGFFRMNGI